ncbi:hypothetical protein AURDEDRAFT_163364 [Auricularia subglabra TFB-10046 SS5]|nr:hypothetical protein AURDEDRAFT_163364 [Auricularia subglabra TFB-10046 SS5]
MDWNHQGEPPSSQAVTASLQTRSASSSTQGIVEPCPYTSEIISYEQRLRVVYTYFYFQGSSDQLPTPCACVGAFFDDETLDRGERMTGILTGQRAELMSIVHAIERAPTYDGPLLIKTTSLYTVNVLDAMRAGWSSPYDSDIQLHLVELLALRGARHMRVDIQLVRGTPISVEDVEGFQNAQYLAETASMDSPAPQPAWITSDDTFSFGEWTLLEQVSSGTSV